MTGWRPGYVMRDSSAGSIVDDVIGGPPSGAVDRAAGDGTAGEKIGSRVRSVSAWALWSAVILALGVTTVLPRPTIAGGIGLVAVAVGLVALYQATFADTFSPVAVTFWAFATIWVGFAPLFQIRDRRLPWPDLPLDQHFVSAQIILLFALVAFWAGNGGAARTRRRREGDAPLGRTTPTPEKSVVVTAFATLLAAACLPMTGGLAVRFTSRDSLQAAITAAGLKGHRDLALLGLLSIFPAAVSAVALVLCLLCWRNRTAATRRARVVLSVTTIVAAALNIVYNNPLSANRFAAFGVLLAAGLAVVRLNRQLWRTLFSVGMLLGLAVVYPLANLFRNERSRGRLRLGLDAYYTWDFDGFQQTVNAVHYVDVHGHTWGHHLLSALLFWVPRSLWEGKAIPAGNAVAAARGYQFQNLSLPFWTEVYVEFSFVGVIVLFYGYGRLARRLDLALADRPAGLATALAVMFAAFQIGMLRGPLGSQIPFVGAAFVVLVAAVLLLRTPGWVAGRTGSAARPAVAVPSGGAFPGDGGRPEDSARDTGGADDEAVPTSAPVEDHPDGGAASGADRPMVGRE